MKKKFYKNEKEINRLCILKKLIKLKKQDYLSINLSIYVLYILYIIYIFMYFYVYVCISGHPNYQYQYKEYFL